jgi:cyclophilin family peptidyl-prolyl cis-trans isomerase
MKAVKLVLLFLCVVVISCDSYKQEFLNDEYKKGTPLDKLVEVKGRDILVATIETDAGNIQLELFSDKAPLAVKNFVGLALQGYYDGLIFHRIIKGFMIQTGDSLGTGNGGRSIYGKEFVDETSPNVTFAEPGMLAMANTGPASNLSQFFITVARVPHLNRKHTIFGKVIEGMDVVNKMNGVKTDRSGMPEKTITMKKVLIEKRVY